MEQSPFWETNSCPPSKEISYLELNMKVDCPLWNKFLYTTPPPICWEVLMKNADPQYSATVCTLHFVVVNQSTSQ